MKVLVAVGSKYGATREVGAEIVAVLRDRGFETDFMDACDVANAVRFYDAAVIGSAVYGGLWRKDASALVRDNAQTLRARDTWLFSVGMTQVTKPDQPLDEAEELAAAAGAIEHKRFGGTIQFEKLNIGEKALIKAINPPPGDFRDFEDIREWAEAIAQRLQEDVFD
ncbi:MAG: flavodoxin domain-containing protein [Demequina sp.]|jgi:menaquinone-dependent protoporphyrinogen oxidase|nr:flavodoxin domain-containing protein [Demequina sp.]